MFGPKCDIDERLPKDVLPIHYRIKIIPNLDSLTTIGTVRMTLEAKESTDKILFNICDIEVEDVKLRPVKEQSYITIQSQHYLNNYGYCIVLAENLIKNVEYYLDVVYKGELNPHLQGFYKITYVDHEGTLKKAASTQFSPTDARRAFPCFDEPFFKASFTISIARPSDMITISNMPLENSEPLVGSDNWVWDHYLETPKMSTYIVGFMVINLKTNSDKNNLIRVWCRGNLLEKSKYANDVAPKILQFLENYFTIKYPLPKMDLVAVPEFGFSAMENWGLITFRESALLYDENSSTIDDKKRISMVMGHEITHQWFGNLVTPKSWNDLWLKEGFATYFEYLSMNQIEPTWNILEEFITLETTRAFNVDAFESARPISAHLINCQQIRETFDEISYAKGAALVQMMHHFLGDEAFQSGLIKVLNEYQYGNIDCDDLFQIMDEEAHRLKALKPDDSFEIIMKSWTKQPGFPVLTVKVEENGLVLSQERFLFSKTKDHSSNWWIPISLATDLDENFDNTRPFDWLRGENRTKLLINFKEWYLLNLKQTSYYAVNYDEKNWRSLIDNIGVFPRGIHNQLLANAMDLARAGLLAYDIPLTLMKTLFKLGLLYGNTLTIAKNKLSFLKCLLSNTSAGLYIREFPGFQTKKPVVLAKEKCERCCRCSTCNFYRDNLGELINVNSSIKVQDAGSVFSAWANQKPDLAFDFLRRHWFKLQERYGDGFNILARMVSCLTPYLYKQEDLCELTGFRNTMKDNLSTTTQAFDIAIETVKSNLEWMEKHYKYVEQWLINDKNELPQVD